MSNVSLIKPLTLGNKTFPVNIIQGPLAGVSCAPFRALTWRYSKPAFSCTEMISCNTLIHQLKFSQQRLIVKNPEEGPVCFQLSGNKPVELAIATKIATDHGADLIDFNCGCPVKKIRGRGAGSKLLSDASQLYKLIQAMKENTHLPVSVKIRVEGGSNEKFNCEIASAVQEGGADFLVVHGRHWTEQYETPCHHEQIQFFVEKMKIPVIGNGDISCVNSLKKMLKTGCLGVMIGRAGVGQPWLIGQLIAEMNNQPFAIPSKQEIGAIFLEHVMYLAQLLGNEKFAIWQARQFAKYYARVLSNSLEFCEKVNRCEKLDELHSISSSYFNVC